MEPAKADHDRERLGETAEFIAELERLARALIGTVALGTSHEGRAGARGLGVSAEPIPSDPEREASRRQWGGGSPRGHPPPRGEGWR